MAHVRIWTFVITIVSLAIAAACVLLVRSFISPVQLIANVATSLSLLWSAMAAVITWRVSDRQRTGGDKAPARAKAFIAVARPASLMLAMLPAVLVSVVLMMRLVYVGIDLVLGEPVFGRSSIGFDSAGLCSLTGLLLVCAISGISTRDRRLLTCAFWLSVAIGMWVGLLAPTFRSPPGGESERAGSSVIIMACLSGVLFVFSFAAWRLDYSRKWRLARADPDRLVEPARPWPGLRQSFVAVAALLIALLAFHLVVPTAIRADRFRETMLLTAVSGLTGATAIFLALSRSFSAPLAEAGIRVLTLSLCAITLVIAPRYSGLLVEEYPTIFSALMVGLASGAALWTWLVGVWRQQLDGGQAWTTAGRLIPHIKRGAFLDIALALLIGALLAVWPRLRGISTMDDSFGAVFKGLWANLYVLLVTLFCARRLLKLTFHFLVLLCSLVMVGFLLMRLLPFTSSFG